MNPIDIPEIARDFGLFVAMAVAAIVVMGWTIRALWNRLNVQIDGRMEDHKTHSAQMAENTKTLERALDVMEGRRG